MAVNDELDRTWKKAAVEHFKELAWREENYENPQQRYEEFYRPGDRLCGLVVRVLDYRSGGPGSIPGTNKKKISGSGTGSTQPREYN
jgi:hypothetical protein